MGKQLAEALKSAGLHPQRKPHKGKRPAGISLGGRPAILSATQARSGPAHPPKSGESRQERDRAQFARQMRQLENVYHGATASRTTRRISTKQPEFTVMRSGAFARHPLFRDDPGPGMRCTTCQHDGIAKQISGSPTDASDLILGLDFGTSTVKAVIRDHTGGQAFAIPFTASPENPYVLPSHVFRDGNAYSLDRGSVIRDLKLRLLDPALKHPAEELDDACAFLALVIRHCRGWLFDNYKSRYKNQQLTWRANLGLPVRSYEDERNVRLFHRLAWAAANLAADESRVLTSELVSKYRKLSLGVIGAAQDSDAEDYEFSRVDVDVVPEIAAQVHGYIDSSRWDARRSPMMLMIDVGAGTVDVALFSVAQSVGGARFSFFADDVQRYGVMNLHRERCDWLRKVLEGAGLLDITIRQYLDDVEKPTDRIEAIPESVLEYLRGISFAPEQQSAPVDREFYARKYSAEVFGCIRRARREKGVPDSQLQRIPLFLCGGGGRMRYYSQIADAINSAPINVTVDRTRLPIPGDLFAKGLRDIDYDRLSVAYGLSRQGAGGRPLGKYIRSIDIPAVEPLPKWDYTANFIEQ